MLSAALWALAPAVDGPAGSYAPAVIAAGAAAGLRCEICDGQNVKTELVGVYSSVQQRGLRVALGLRVLRVSEARGDVTFVPAHTETFLSLMVHSEGPLFGFGLGFHHARQVVLPFEMTAALPSVALRVGRQNGLHAYASFGDFGSFAETSGDLQLGLGVSPLPLLKVWTGVTAELSPSYGYEVGVLWHALRTLGVALVGGVSPLDGQQYQSIMVGLEWRDEHDLPTSWQGE